MCDIYSHKCNDANCSTTIEMHLMDFATKRDEIEVYCGTHFPRDKKYRECGYVEEIRLGKSKTRIFIKPLTENAKKNFHGNVQNGDGKIIEAFGKTGKELDKFLNEIHRARREQVLRKFKNE